MNVIRNVIFSIRKTYIKMEVNEIPNVKLKLEISV